MTRLLVFFVLACLGMFLLFFIPGVAQSYRYMKEFAAEAKRQQKP